MCSISWRRAASFPYWTVPVCFFGYTHVPVAFMRDTVVRGGTFSKFKVDPAKKYFVNVGAVGQPRDNNPKAAYVIYDLDAATIELRQAWTMTLPPRSKKSWMYSAAAPGRAAGVWTVIRIGDAARTMWYKCAPIHTCRLPLKFSS